MAFNVHPARATVAVLALCAAAAPSAAAQSVGAVERCRAMPTIGERLACLEEVVNEYERSDGALEKGAAPAVVVAPAPAPVAPPEAASLPEPAGVAEPVAVAAPAAPRDAAAAPSGIGAEQVLARRSPAERGAEEREPPAEAYIVAHAIHGFAQLEVTLDNGQVWRQLQGDNQRIRLRGDEPIAVTIRQSRFGGYRMEINRPRREIQVERIR